MSDQTITILIIFTLLAFEGRAIVLINRIFWIPYFSYYVGLVVSIFLCRAVISRKIAKLDFGYSFKILLRISKILIKAKEVKSIMKGVRYDKVHDYVCECDRKLPKEEQAVFKVRFLTVDEQAELRDLMYSIKGMGASRQENFLTGSMAVRALKMGLQGWDNFYFEDNDEPIPFAVENFSCIPPKQRDEIANYIRGIEEGEA